MPKGNELLATIEAVHAAGLDVEHWPAALAAVAKLFGGAGAMYEVFEIPSGRPIELRTFGIPSAAEFDYLEHYVPANPRAAYARSHAGDRVLWDYKALDERAMDRDPFYAELLGRVDFRYFISGQVFQTPGQIGVVSAQRTPTQGRRADRQARVRIPFDRKPHAFRHGARRHRQAPRPE
jgi:hypothetical protein